MSVSIVIATVLAQALPAALPAPLETAQPMAEIVVTAERLRRFKMRTKTDRRTGQQRCIVKQSSGDRGFDAEMCRIVIDCGTTAKIAPDVQPCVISRIERRNTANALRQPEPVGTGR